MIGGTICGHSIGAAARTSGRARRGPLTSMLNRLINMRIFEISAAVTTYYTYLQVTRTLIVAEIVEGPGACEVGSTRQSVG
jgi:hypothetical protein